MTAAWIVQRVLQEHVGRGEFADDLRIPRVAPEVRKPAAYDDLVFLFFGHVLPLCCCHVLEGASEHRSAY